MKMKVISLMALIAMLFGAMALPSTAAAQVATQEALSTPITGTVEDGGTFEGNFVINKFMVHKGQLVAKGKISGTLYDEAGNVIGDAPTRTVFMPVSGDDSASALSVAQTCDVLNLVLGPLDLNLLGLEVHLDTVVLDIIANPAGGLLGDLLCAVANLLDNPLSDLFEIAGLLNQILDLLG